VEPALQKLKDQRDDSEALGAEAPLMPLRPARTGRLVRTIIKKPIVA
jgi:hypothetical protein